MNVFGPSDCVGQHTLIADCVVNVNYLNCICAILPDTVLIMQMHATFLGSVVQFFVIILIPKLAATTHRGHMTDYILENSLDGFDGYVRIGGDFLQHCLKRSALPSFFSTALKLFHCCWADLSRTILAVCTQNGLTLHGLPFFSVVSMRHTNITRGIGKPCFKKTGMVILSTVHRRLL